MRPLCPSLLAAALAAIPAALGWRELHKEPDLLLPPRGPRRRVYYSVKTGKARFAIQGWAGDVTVTAKGQTAEVSGGGCSATVPLGPHT